MPETKICPECGREFVPKSPHQKYCKTFGGSIGSGKTRCAKRASDRRRDRRFSEEMKEKHRKRNRDLTRRRREEGKCTRCGGPVESGALCGLCMVDLRKYR